MASKLFLCFAVPILIFPAPLNALQLHIPDSYLPFRPRSANSTRVVVHVDKIQKNLWEAGYKIMSLILEQKLCSLIPSARPIEHGNFVFFNNNTITIFVPPDKAVAFGSKWMDLKYQIVPLTVGREFFTSPSEDVISKLPTLERGERELVVSQRLADGDYASINNVKVTHWYVYGDEHVTVHGVEDFFDYELGSGGGKQWPTSEELLESRPNLAADFEEFPEL